MLTLAPPRSILVLSGPYHIMSNASIVNNCIRNVVLDIIFQMKYRYPDVELYVSRRRYYI